MMRRYLKYIRRKWASISFTRAVSIHLNEPVISFTFDDAPVSAFVNGGNILSKYGMSGTFYISMSLMSGVEESTRFTIQHLKDAIAQHNELPVILSVIPSCIPYPWKKALQTSPETRKK